MIEIILITAWVIMTCGLAYTCFSLVRKNSRLSDNFSGMKQSRDYWKDLWNYHTLDDIEDDIENALNIVKPDSNCANIKIVEYSSGQYSIHKGEHVYSQQGEWVTLEEANRWNFNHCLYDSFDVAKSQAKTLKDNFVIVNTFDI